MAYFFPDTVYSRTIMVNILHYQSKNWTLFYLTNNFGKYCPILIILSLFRRKVHVSAHKNWISHFTYSLLLHYLEQEVKVIWQKAPHGGPIPRLGVTPGGRKLYRWIPGVGFPISVP